MDRLLIIANGTIFVYRFRKELVAALAEYKEVFVVAPNDGFAEELQDLGVSYIEMPMSRRKANLFQDFVLLCRFVSLIRRIKPSQILTYTIKPNIYGNFAARLFNIPVISTVSGLGDGFLNPGIVGKIVKVLYKLAFRKVRAVVFENEENEKDMRQVGIIKNQRVIFIPGSGVNLQEHEILNHPDNEHISFLYIGRIMYSKGIYELINAARRLKSEQVYEFSVNLMGFNEEGVSEILAQAEEENVVSVLGFQKNTAPFIEDSHCVVLPSHSEGMSNALLEAAARGRSLIATNISGCREIVEDGVNGFLCTPRDENSLYDCMKRFLGLSQDERREMAKASRKKVEEKFNREIVVNTMISEIDTLDLGVHK